MKTKTAKTKPKSLEYRLYRSSYKGRPMLDLLAKIDAPGEPYDGDLTSPCMGCTPDRIEVLRASLQSMLRALDLPILD